MPTVWLVSPAWRRFAVTRLALAQRAHLVTELAARGLEAHCVVVADDENLDIAREFGFETVEMNNRWLGRRFNAGYEYAARQGADYFVHIGSDDWVHPDVFGVLPYSELAAGDALPTPELPVVVRSNAPAMVVGSEIAIVDLLGGRMRRCRTRGRTGVVPWILPRRLLERSGFRPIREDAERGIDGSLVCGLGLRPNIVFHDPHPLARVDFKSAVNLTPYGALAHLGRGRVEDPWPALAEIYPAELVELARETHENLAAAAA